MNLFFRLFLHMVLGRFRSAVPVLGPCRTPFRVLPTDLDLLRHMNNAVYLSLMDLARMDLLRRSGLLRRVVANGWYPIVVAETIQFRRSLLLFDRFEIETRALSWDEKSILIEQRFERAGETVAIALVRGRFLMRGGGTVPVTEILALAGVSADTTVADVPAYARRWDADQSTWHGDDTSRP